MLLLPRVLHSPNFTPLAANPRKYSFSFLVTRDPPANSHSCTTVESLNRKMSRCPSAEHVVYHASRLPSRYSGTRWVLIDRSGRNAKSSYGMVNRIATRCRLAQRRTINRRPWPRRERERGGRIPRDSWEPIYWQRGCTYAGNGWNTVGPGSMGTRRWGVRWKSRKLALAPVTE